MTQARYDTIHKYETPEGVDLEFHIAGLFVRSAAWAVDCFIRAICYGVIACIAACFGDVGVGIMLIFFFFIEWFYYVFFEVNNGQTPGKSFFNIKVVMDNGAPLLWSAALIRNFLRGVDYLPFCNALGCVVLLYTSRFQRIGDIAAGTIVIYEEGKKGKHKRNNTQRDEKQSAKSINENLCTPPPVPLTQAEQGLIFEYCQREQSLSAGRSNELAAMLPSLTGTYTPKERLLGLGKWLLYGFEKNETA